MSMSLNALTSNRPLSVSLISGMTARDKNARLISVIENINEDIIKSAKGSASLLGTGGMVTKVKAAMKVNAANCDMVIAKGDDPSIIYSITEGESVGTLFSGRG